MADISNGMGLGESGSDSKLDRRSFLRSAATTSLVGLVGSPPVFVTPADAAQQDVTEDPKTPPGLGPHGIPDGRFPICYEVSVPESVGVIAGYFAALSRRDLKGLAEFLHFPFATYEGAECVVVETPDDLIAHAPASVSMTEKPERFTDHDGYLKPGAYDVFDGIEVFDSDPVRVNLSMSYNRYDSNGKKLLRCDGIYCVTNNDGKWGIQLMSTIFTPADMVGVVYNDSIQAAKRLREDHCLAYMVNDERAVWGPIRQLGKNVGIGGGGTWQVASHGNDRIMQGFRFKGVKNRLSVTDATQETLDKTHTDFAAYRALWPSLGLGNWGWDLGGGPPARVIHATVDKVHAFQGASRYTTAGEYINDSVELDVITYVKGRWGISAIFAYITTHDRANDAPNIRT